MFFYPFFGEGSPTKIDYRKRGTLILTSLLENLSIYIYRVFLIEEIVFVNVAFPMLRNRAIMCVLVK